MAQFGVKSAKVVRQRQLQHLPLKKPQQLELAPLVQKRARSPFGKPAQVARQ